LVNVRIKAVPGGKNMLRTITIGSCVSIQGLFVKALANGRIRVSVGDKYYDGTPVNALETA
jgi:hypothetical protein